MRGRAWLGLVGGAFLLLTTGFGLVAWRAHRSLSADPSQVVQALSRALGRPVEADVVQVTWWPPGLVVHGVQVPDESPLGPGNVVHADELRLVVGSWALLLGDVVVKRIEVASPVVRLVRGVDGDWNFEKREPGSSPALPTVALATDEAQMPRPVSRPAFDLVDLRVTRGRLSLRDRAVPGVPEFEITGLDARLRRTGEDARLEFRGDALGGPPGNLAGAWSLPQGADRSVLEIWGSEIPASRLPEVLQLARGSVPFGAALDGVVSSEATASLPAVWPPESAEVLVTVDARDASATAAGGYITKRAGTPLALELRLDAYPDRLSVKRAGFVSGDAMVEVVAVEAIDGAAAEEALRVTSTGMTADALVDWIPVLEAVAPRGALDLTGTLLPVDGDLGGRLRLAGTDLGIRLGEAPAGLGAVAVAVELSQGDGFDVGVSFDDFVSGDLTAARIVASIAGEETGGLRLRVDGEGGGRGDARVDRLALEVEVSDAHADVRRLAVEGLGGTLEAEGEISRDEENAILARFSPQWDGVDFAGLFRLFGVEVDAQGLFTGEAALSARRSAEETFEQTLTGVFGARLDQARLPDVNLARSTLDDLKSVPGVGPRFARRAEEVAPELLAQTSDIEALSVDGSVGGEILSLSSVRLRAPAYDLDAQGKVDFEGGVDLLGDLVLNQETTDALVAVSKAFRVLAPEGKPIRIPVEIQGRYPELVSAPSPAFVSETLSGLVGGGAVEEAEGLLRQLFGGGQGSDSEEP